MNPKRARCARAVTLVEIMVTIVVLLLMVLGTSGLRSHTVRDARRAEAQVTAVRLASLLLNGWKGSGGHSGYSNYELSDPGDYDPSDPNDYDPADADPVELGPGLGVRYSAPGPAVPDGYSPLDLAANPNYEIVVNSKNYYATLSYKDQLGEPRALNVCVAWMKDYQAWNNSKPYRSVTLATYADD